MIANLATLPITWAIAGAILIVFAVVVGVAFTERRGPAVFEAPQGRDRLP